MSLPFSRDEFLGVFAAYNEAVWPLQIVMLLLAVGAVAATWTRRAHMRWAVGGLALLWIWMGVAYHIAFFTTINPLAYLFGALFLAQAALLLWYGIRRGNMRLAAREQTWTTFVGWAFVAFALVGYPVVGFLAGQRYPAFPTFGLPCPTVIYTLGILIWAAPVPWQLLVIPALWAIVGTSAAISLDVVQDAVLLPAAVMAVAVILRRRATRGLREAQAR